MPSHMDKVHLPLKIDPFRFTEKKAVLKGVIPLKDLKRLGKDLKPQIGDAKVYLQFGVDEAGIAYVIGKIGALLGLQCQRCLEFFDYPLASEFSFGLVTTEEEANKLTSSYDPVIVKEDTLMVKDLIEEELIINLPIVAMHVENECRVKLPFVAAEGNNKGTKNPFDIIKSLRSNNK